MHICTLGVLLHGEYRILTIYKTVFFKFTVTSNSINTLAYVKPKLAV